MKYKHIALICLMGLLMLQACQAKESVPESLDIPIETTIPIQTEPQPVIIETTPSVESEESMATLSEIIDENELAKYFEEYDSAVMLLTDGISNVAYNEALSDEQHSPFSTFKIPNSLIALEKDVINIDNSLRKWDGITYTRPELNQDQDLASALKHSCVWYYKQLANEVGGEYMQRYIHDIGYGNMDISGGIDEFWLGSSLLISPKEQLDFIIRLYHNELPFEPENMDYVKSIMKQDGYGIDLYGKTGSSGNGMGWFVGYALLDDKPVFFVTYIEGAGTSGLIARDLTAQIINDFMSD